MYLFIPIFCAVIGWITNKLAIYMLFHPKKEYKILFFRIQGLVPRNQQKIAENFSNLVGNELVNINKLFERNAEEIKTLLIETLDKKLTGYLDDRLEATHDGMKFILKSFFDAFKEVIIEELESHIPELIDDFKNKASSIFDIKSMVREKVMQYSTDELEKLILSVSKRELKAIIYLGAVLGFIIGCFQLLFFI